MISTLEKVQKQAYLYSLSIQFDKTLPDMFSHIGTHFNTPMRVLPSLAKPTM